MTNTDARVSQVEGAAVTAQEMKRYFFRVDRKGSRMEENAIGGYVLGADADRVIAEKEADRIGALNSATYWKDHYTGASRRCAELVEALASRDAEIVGLRRWQQAALSWLRADTSPSALALRRDACDPTLAAANSAGREREVARNDSANPRCT